MEHNYFAKYDNVLLRPLQKDDIELLRCWRNNVYETRFLRTIGHITEQMQKEWYTSYLNRESEIIFAIVETKKLKRIVGSVSIYDIQEDIAEIGKIQIGDNDAHGKGIGRKSLVMAMKIAFELTSIKRFVASVHRENISARTNDLRIGFSIVGQHESEVGGYEDELEIDLTRLKDSNLYYNDIIVGSNYGSELIYEW